ncbi:hypothetical protein [uncultured Muriicola sp.]|uniref:hypothetical protein n=1 Tax=uncultured Muriicola sp. TaxID=1583102 RepID=UPI00262514A3|nr:hypothetical protein [uncultured Muriicola sp.]
MKLFLSFFLCVLSTGCAQHGQLNFVCDLPNKFNENSGITTLENDKIWLIEDNGNDDVIYEVSTKGARLREFKVKNAKNDDWEDLTKDDKGNLYIGDFGNNDNNRKDLVIYKIPNPTIEPGDKIEAEKINFKFPEQKEYPPIPSQRKYDTEAFFHLDDVLYLITKDRSNPFYGEALIYTVPAKAGNYDAKLVGTFKTCNKFTTCQITSAAISPDKKKIVLLGYGSLWLITKFDLPNFSKGTVQFIDLGVRTQLEALCFKDNSTMLLSDERNHNTGGNLYTFTLPK